MNDTKHNHRMSPTAAAVTGAVIGAGVAAAGAVVMNDEKNRAKVKEVFNTVKNQAVEYMDNMQAQDSKDMIGKKVTDGKKSASSPVNEKKGSQTK